MTDFQKNDSKEYIKAWTKNSKQHYDDGDYDYDKHIVLQLDVIH